MKQRIFFIFMWLLIAPFFSTNGSAQDSSQWNLPDGAIARLGNGFWC